MINYIYWSYKDKKAGEGPGRNSRRKKTNADEGENEWRGEEGRAHRAAVPRNIATEFIACIPVQQKTFYVSILLTPCAIFCATFKS